MYDLMKRFWRWPRVEKQLFFSALFWFGYYFFLLRVLPSSKIKNYLCEKPAELCENHTNVSAVIRQVRAAIYRLMRFLRLQNKCLVYALTARKMLGNDGVKSSLYLGLRKKDASWVAHAWLCSGTIDVVGCEEKEIYKIIQEFKA
jgi:hypothetical protein